MATISIFDGVTLQTMYCHLGAQPVETHFYNRNTSSHFPKLFPSSFPSSAILNYQVGDRCTLVPFLPFPVLVTSES